MMIDSIINVPVSQDADLRINKKDEGQEDLRPVEESGKGNGPELNFNKEEASGVRSADRKADSGDARQEIYSAEGRLLKDNRVEEEVNTDAGNIDIMV